ncbi:MAG: hypothetical protein KME27_18185 [Lyngbya sp. HA4199-MV5]|jgi:hypothetical protein|nr:hypothetical protein [Lyngbya sp. HA4199-MV5]
MLSKTTFISKFPFLKSKTFALLLIAYLIPFVVLLWFVANFGINFPYWDQWDLIELFQKVFLKQATFQDFFAQHNEHRILFPQIIIITLAFLSKWNIQWELYCSVALSAIVFILLLRISLAQTKQRNLLFHAVNVSICFVVFSLCQWENWMWGFQVAWFLVNLCLVVAILAFSSALHSSLQIKVAVAASACLVASFSSAHGLVTWLAIVPSLLACCRGRLQCLKVGFVWVILFLSTLFFYFIDYHKPPHHPDLWFFLKEPQLAATYFLTLLGSPLLHRSNFSYIFGFLALISFGFFIAHCARKAGSGFFRDAAPWLSLGCFAILFDLMTTLGRAGFGVEQAYSSRYTTVSLLLLVALLQLWHLYRSEPNAVEPSRLFKRNDVSVSLFAIGILTSLVLVASIKSLPEAEVFRSRLQYGQACLDVADYVKQSPGNCLELIHPRPNLVVKRAAILNQMNFRHFPGKTIEFVAEPTKGYGFLDTPPTSQAPPIVRKNCFNCGPIPFNGWAILPEQDRAAQLVFLQRDGDPEPFFANAQVNSSSPDVAKALRNENYRQARWSTVVSPNLLPSGKTVVKAWVYDPGKKQFVKLQGELALSVEE